MKVLAWSRKPTGFANSIEQRVIETFKEHAIGYLPEELRPTGPEDTANLTYKDIVQLMDEQIRKACDVFGITYVNELPKIWTDEAPPPPPSPSMTLRQTAAAEENPSKPAKPVGSASSRKNKDVIKRVGPKVTPEEVHSHHHAANTIPCTIICYHPSTPDTETVN